MEVVGVETEIPELEEESKVLKVAQRGVKYDEENGEMYTGSIAWKQPRLQTT